MTTLLDIQPLLREAYKRKKGRPGKPRPIFIARQVEMQYTKELLAISKFCQDAAAELVIPVFGEYVGDSLFSNAIDKLKKKLAEAADKVADKIADKIIEGQKKESDAQLASQLETMTGLDLRGIFKDEDLKQAVDEAIAANVKLIKSIPEKYADQLEATILNGLQEGKRVEDIEKDLVKIGEMTDKRAKIIARDQLGKINGRFSQIRQQKLGITHYYWSTSQDERVRHTHKQRDGRLYAWADAPEDGHPGIPILCRCVPIPYLAHILDPKAPTPEELMAKQAANDEFIAAKAKKAS